MTDPLILSFYRKLPQPEPLTDDDIWTAGLQEALREFRQSVVRNYSEATLSRLLSHGKSAVRQAAVLALGLAGTLESNLGVAGALRDDDPMVRRFAHDALWEIWFRGNDNNHCWALQQALQLSDHLEMLAALDDLIEEAPTFAEAINQRAILHFRRCEFARCVADCKNVLRLNPVHFAAAAGMGQSYLRLKKPRAALRAFETALSIYPDLTDLQDAVRTLQDVLGES